MILNSHLPNHGHDGCERDWGNLGALTTDANGFGEISER